MERDFKGVWIPKEIYLDDKLNWTEKILLIEIDSLNGVNGCFASNEHFAKHLMISKDRVSRLISNLITKGYIISELEYKQNSKQIVKRTLRTKLGYCYKYQEGIVENTNTPIGENTKDNNTIYNNTSNIYINIYSRVVEYLNKKADMKYRSNTKKTQQLIRARQQEGFTEDDFKLVIDNKVAEWLGTDMEKFLRPETLFGTKFESYLNQKGGKKNGRKQKSGEYSDYNFKSKEVEFTEEDLRRIKEELI